LKQEVIAVVGVAQSGVIGAAGAIPWRSPRDMQHFKSLTIGHPIVMGRKTFESIGKPLPHRRNIVMTRDTLFVADGIEVVHSKEEALSLLADQKQIMIIGGDQIYSEFYDTLTKIEITVVDLEVEGDAFFSLHPSRDWIISQQSEEFDEKLGAKLRFLTYKPDRSKNKYLTTDVKGLLRMFGAGEAVPGSGAAAALQGLLSAYLSLTVIAKSREKRARATTRYLAQQAFQISAVLVPRLRELFLKDIATFDSVIELRRLRDSTSGSAKARFTRSHGKKMIEATRIPDEIFKISAELREVAEHLFWNGWQSVRGDSGAALSAALSAMLSSNFIMTLNATKFDGAVGDEWARTLSDRNRDCLAALSKLPALISLTPSTDDQQSSFAFLEEEVANQ
jgi:dihydrofolate reductase